MNEKYFDIEDSGSPKKFEIKNVTPTEKKFEIEKVKSSKNFQFEEIAGTSRKNFQIHEEKGGNTPLEWYQQNNSYDCGPCMILNALPRLGVADLPKSVEEVRNQINQIRLTKKEQILGPKSWLMNFDIRSYLEKFANLHIEMIPTSSEGKTKQMEEIQDEISKGVDIIFFDYGSHFRAVIPLMGTAGQYLLLDSFNNAPQAINQTGLNDLFEESFKSREVRTVGIGRKKN